MKAYKESLVERLKVAAQKMAVGSMDPMPHIIALALEDEEIAADVGKRIKGKMVGSAQLLSTGGDLQSGIEGIVELPIYSDNPDDILKEPICLFANLKSKKVALVNRPESTRLASSVMTSQPSVSGGNSMIASGGNSITIEGPPSWYGPPIWFNHKPATIGEIITLLENWTPPYINPKANNLAQWGNTKY